MTNVEVLASPSLKIANRILGRSSYRLQTTEKGPLVYEFSAVVVDPPRAGLDNVTLQAIQQYSTIIYISCFPPKLLQDISQVSNYYSLM